MVESCFKRAEEETINFILKGLMFLLYIEQGKFRNKIIKAVDCCQKSLKTIFVLLGS